MTLLSFIFRLLISCEQRKTKERTVCVCVCVGARANFPADGAPTKHKTRLRAKDCERDALIMIIIITMMMGSDDYYTVEGRPFFLREMYGRQAPPPPVRRKRNFGKKKTFWFFFFKKNGNHQRSNQRASYGCESGRWSIFFPPSLRQFDRTKKEIVE